MTTPIIGGGVAAYLSWYAKACAGTLLLSTPITLPLLCLLIGIYRIIH